MNQNFERVINSLKDGLLSFPITDMDNHGKFNESSFKDRLEWFLTKEVSAIFVAGGTGEFFSLSKREYQQIVQITTKTVRNKVPAISSIGRSIPEAIDYAGIAEDAGIDALLLMPPYLINCAQRGVYEYAKAIIQSTNLPVIYYNRANGLLSAEYIQKLADECPNLVGLKDGPGNMKELNTIIKTLGNRLVYIGGYPTAEIISEAYLSIGVNTYSSAVFNFVPDLAILFYKSLKSGDKETVDWIIRDFFIPFVKLRTKEDGYAVSLIKAGAFLIGMDGGVVRPPLTIPKSDEIMELQKLIDVADGLLL